MKAPQLWSAAPTPLTANFEVDAPSVERMIHAAIADGMTGVFLAGTCGEGPWLPDRERRRLIAAAAQAAGGRLHIAAQVSDNSVPRILDNIQAVAKAGANYAVISHPATMMNATPERIAALFREAATLSPLPVGIYDLGSHRPFAIHESYLAEIYRLPNVHMVKDSSVSAERQAIALAARRQNPSLLLFNGSEFHSLPYLAAGYDGSMFGGAAVVSDLLRQQMEHFLCGRMREAKEVDDEMKAVLYGIYGGESIACWLAGLKYCMVRKGVFTSTVSYLGYPLTDDCRSYIDRYTADRTLCRLDA